MFSIPPEGVNGANLRMAAQLRCFAEQAPGPNESGWCNLASWVGCRTPAWYTVFSYSGPHLLCPWFCMLDLEAQRTVLLLVAEILESQSDQPGFDSSQENHSSTEIVTRAGE